MAGSRAWYLYTDDDDETYGVELDEDIGSLANAGFTAYPNGDESTTLPTGWRMRYVNFVQTSGAGAGFRSRRVPCGTSDATIFSGATSTVTIGGITYARSSTRGETKRIPKSVPTGLSGVSNIVGGGA